MGSHHAAPHIAHHSGPQTAHHLGPQIARSRGRAGVRDAGLLTLRRVNHWMAASAVVLAGATSAVTWHAFRAHAAGLAHAAALRSVPVRHAGDDGGSPAARSGAPAPPQSAPQPTQASTPAAAAPAVSGGS